ncbi:5-dehydro-2-deoxygluconokinase [Alteromonas sp. 38]|uniref:bifunctional 5-dehydro-2-deoxygluconokinase/5-dehydro-2- deoxyphosphogluconate aldolase n=1 Tax=Alteromonas TaxID=226 RepID=UPI0012EFB5B0|nr:MULTISPECIES: 5-dehydro-2-deoxygluconokinase [Alteromonas]CAD5262765.1 5-dehydro-2-deoxygluconokinase [Alteromonas sp. 154]VXC22500.1 5-dehydro-2-deoxygluconokinase [Alteromonas sp. 38]
MQDAKTLDLICLGRASVDLYGQQIGNRLQDISTFAKSLGGSSCNICFGAARLGLKSSMLTRVGDEQFGQFIREELDRVGVDTSHVVTDKQRLTALAILSIKSKEEFPLLFYRADCADMAVDISDFDEQYIASAKALLITGTHFSTPHVDAVARKAIEYARKNNTKVILDVDYRPVLWGLTRPGEGDNRFVSNSSVSEHLQSIIPLCDLIVGTEEEIHIAGGVTDTLAALQNVRQLTDATIVLKRGEKGCSIFDDAIPPHIDDAFFAPGVRVDVLNVLGAGDAFMSGFLRGWLREEGFKKACAYGNAAGALVVSRHGCAPAIPSADELDYYIANQHSIERPDIHPELNYLHRVTTRQTSQWQDLCILAFDHRKQFVEMANEAGADLSKIKTLKALILQALEQTGVQGNNQVGVLIDDTFGQDALNAVTGKRWWVGRPVEVPGSRPIELEGGRSIGSRLVSWPQEHIVKCLVFMHPDDDAAMWEAQSKQIEELYAACCQSGHELLLEIIPPSDIPADDTSVVRAMEMIYDLNVRPDWWKLPPPSPAAWKRISDLVNKRSPHCRGIILLGLDAPIDALIEGFSNSAKYPLCKGFAVGRSIFSAPSKDWLAGKIDDEVLMKVVAENYLTLVSAWNTRKDI